MKKITLLLSSILVVLAFSACDDESGNLTPPTTTELLTRTWRVESITVEENGEEVSASEYQNLSITFTKEGSYTVDRLTDAFPQQSGTWEWENKDVQRNIVLDKGTDIEVILEVEEIQADLFEIYFKREGGIVSGRVAGTSAGRTIPDREFTITFRSI
jgi:hypothetical protein